MDFEFRRNTLDDSVLAFFSMEHQIIGRWFTEELSTDRAKLLKIKSAMEAVEQRSLGDWRFVGRESTIEITKEQVFVFENCLGFAVDLAEEMEQGFSLYSAESLAYCGFEDFRNALASFEAFLGE